MDRRQDAELTVGMLNNVLRRGLGENWSPLEVHFQHPALVDGSQHRRAFNCNVRFQQPSNLILFRGWTSIWKRASSDGHSRNHGRRHGRCRRVGPDRGGGGRAGRQTALVLPPPRRPAAAVDRGLRRADRVRRRGQRARSGAEALLRFGGADPPLRRCRQADSWFLPGLPGDRLCLWRASRAPGIPGVSPRSA